ncbi:hypothetical protein LCGC14_2566520 [marine sediment metagenome]|uniref:Uncharacterized protein n=1 Tax=marine sediment metagenome TaxID=412755 RepID=A0A0F9AIZ4_9ZZZZ
MTNYSPKSFPQPTTKRKVDREGADFYPTPLWATEALLQQESFEGLVWEPACGDGAMSRVLIANGLQVVSSDLYNRGYGTTGADFLEEVGADFDFIPNIITNPPYNLAGEFVQAAWQKSTKKFAFLLRLAFLEGIDRYESIYTKIPPTRVWVFTKRVTFYPKGAAKKGSGTTAYGWFVWDKQDNKVCYSNGVESRRDTQLCWLPPYRKITQALTLENLGLAGRKK